MDQIKVKNIFAAVFTKQILDPLLAVLDPKEVKFWGTEGTVRYLKPKGFWAKSVVSGFDFDGRIKSIDKKVFAAILADRSKKRHLLELEKLEAAPIDLVIVDLYRLDKKNFPESMDIGGVTLIRAVIKNYKNVALAFDSESIKELIAELKRVKRGPSSSKLSVSLEFRKNQAKKAAKFISERCQLELEMIKVI